MCGLIAYLTRYSTNIFDVLCEAIEMVKNRGYDSVGIEVIENGAFVQRKYANTIAKTGFDLLKVSRNSFDIGHIGHAHSRWKTSSSASDANSHPFVDCHGRFSLVHNGIIENYTSLKKFLIEKGYTFSAETDSEVVVNLISYHYDLLKNVPAAITKAISEISGTWAFSILTILEPNTLYVCKRGSPLLIGFNEHEIMAASETSGFCNRFSQYFALDNDDILALSFNETINTSKYKIHSLTDTYYETSPSPFPHWMLKEIHEQPHSLLRALNNGGRIDSPYTVKLGGLEQLTSRLLGIENLVILACGTSYHAGIYGSYWFKSMGIFNTVLTFDAAEFTLSDLPRKNVGVIILSQSGETKDVHRCVELIRSTDYPIIGVINTVESLLARESDCGVYLNCYREVGVASTKSFTSQCLVLVLISIFFAQHHNVSERKRGLCISSCHSLSRSFGNLLTPLTTHKCVHIASLLSSHKSCFILGRGELYPIALEGALKLKEIGYLHAEGFSHSALKHGSYALIEPGFPIIVLGNDEVKTNILIDQIKSREATVILISNYANTNLKVDHYIEIDDRSELSSILYVSILQLISYYLGISKGVDPDYPRNLAKSVTVD